MLARAAQTRYRELRGDGVPASIAYRIATAAPPSLSYRYGPGDTLIFELDDPALAAFTITAHTEPDPAPDLSWLGTFTDAWSPEAIENSRHPYVYRYFVPTYTVAERRADHSARGCARAEAHRLAEHGVHEDLRLARRLEHHNIIVSVHKTGVLLGTAVRGFDLDPSGDSEDQIIPLIDDHALIDEAVHDARIALADLIATPPVRRVGAPSTPGEDRPNPPELFTPDDDKVDEQAWTRQSDGVDPPTELAIDPHTREGAAILALFRAIKELEHRTNSWPGADIVPRLHAWFVSLGIDPDENPSDVLQRLDPSWS